MKTCLVTGGAGFIGSHLCESLLEEYKVVCLDNLTTGIERNIKKLESENNFKFLEGDIKNRVEIKEDVDYLFHLASRASPVDFKKYPIDIMLSNSLGTLHVLEVAKENEARFLLASTSEVYGDPKRHPQREDYRGNVNTVGPRACYDEGKRFAEALTMNFHRKFGIDVRIARIFNTYGPKMRKNDGRVIPNFVNQALNGEPITVYGTGDQTRSFCYIEDMVQGLEKLMFTPKLEGEVFNLGSDREIPIIQLARIVKNITGTSSKITFQPLPKDDPARRKPEISKARDLLNWRPEIELEEGLKETVDYFKRIQ